MTISIYEKLREQLDQYSIGFPATQSGIEIKILKRLFTEEEAGMYLDMTMMLETPESIAAHTGRNVETVSFILANMAKKGLLFRHRKGKEVKYGAVPFVIGSYEYQLKNMDLELAGMVEDYFQEGFLDFTPKKNMLPCGLFRCNNPSKSPGQWLPTFNHAKSSRPKRKSHWLTASAASSRKKSAKVVANPRSVPDVRLACGLLCRKQTGPVYQPRGSPGRFGYV